MKDLKIFKKKSVCILGEESKTVRENTEVAGEPYLLKVEDKKER